MVHSDQGCQVTNHEWQTFLPDHNPVSSIKLLKREYIRRRIYAAFFQEHDI